MKTIKCLAYVWPIEEYAGEDFALANVKFITGPFAKKDLSIQIAD